MKKKYFLYLLVFVLIIVTLCFANNILVNKRMGLTKAYVAKLDIKERTKIEEPYLLEVTLPKSYLTNDVFLDREDIVGKYVKLDAYIPKGSLFYKGFLEDENQMRDSIYAGLNLKQVTYDLAVRDIRVNPAYLMKGMYCDIYLTVAKKEVISDLLISGAKIIGLYDINNKEVSNYSQDAIISTVSIAVDSDVVPYLNKAYSVGELSLIVGGDCYKDRDTVINLSEDILRALS